jgi:glycosyltransferase involved in cell wall biosynthesis
MAKISVIIPLYNGERFIRETIESVVAQATHDIEVIVVDDGSMDRGGEIVLQMSGPIGYFYQKNEGVTSARNHGFLKSTGSLIAFVDQDDRWYPEKLEIQAHLLDANPGIGIVYSDVDLIDEAGQVIETRHLASQIRQPDDTDEAFSVAFRGYPKPHPFPSTVMMRRNVFIEAGMFDTAFTGNCYEDKELWFRIVKKQLGQFFFIAEPLVQRRCHPLQGERNQEARDANRDVYWNKILAQLDGELRSELSRKLARILSHEGKNLVGNADVRRGRRYLRKSVNYDPFVWKNIGRLLRSYLTIR